MSEYTKKEDTKPEYTKKEDTNLKDIKPEYTKPEDTAIYEYLETGSVVFGFIILVCGIIYLLCTINGMAYFTYTHKEGAWFLLDALIAIGAIILGGLLFPLSDEFKRIRLEKKYAKLKK